MGITGAVALVRAAGNVENASIEHSTAAKLERAEEADVYVVATRDEG